jgi:uncharacterized protein
MTGRSLAAILASLIAVSCVPLGPDGLAWSPGYDTLIRQWRKERYESLRKEDGWLALAGLHWLKEGAQEVGASAGNDIVLGNGPDHLGTFTMVDGRVQFVAEAGVDVTVSGKAAVDLELKHDGGGTATPDKLVVGALTLVLIQRGGKLALRVFDGEGTLRSSFRGVPHYPANPGWRIRGTFVASDQPQKVAVSTVINTTEEAVVPGEIHFKYAGDIFSLKPIAVDGSHELFIVFGDATNGSVTYGGGRFLMVDEPGLDGSVILDFNRATNPPCAFTPYATCPVPWRENRMDLAVEAGEKQPLEGE